MISPHIDGTARPPGHGKPPAGTDRGRVEPGRWRVGSTFARVRAWLGTTPARVWLLTMTAVVTIAGLFVSASITLGHARDGSSLLGHDAGPQAMATTELYLALADMDARMADVLLMGDDHDLGSGRENVLEMYGDSREQAHGALLQAASLTEGDSIEETNVRAVLNGLGEYEQRIGRALLLNDEAGAGPGRIDDDALAEYRRATRLMHTELLPKAFNLGLDSSAIVRAGHEAGQSSVTLGLLGVGGAGTLAITALVSLQVFLRIRFRRRFNVPVLAATAGVLALTAGVVLALDGAAGYQRDAKEEGLNAAMALSRAEAIATDMQADQSRYLLDPEQADNYQQVYLERAQQVLFRPADDLEEYYGQIAEVTESSSSGPSEAGGDDGDDPGTLGYLGQDAQDALIAGQTQALAEVLEAYNGLQEQDRVMRSLVEADDLDGAVEVRMGITHTEDGAFSVYTSSLGGLIDLHVEEFRSGVERGDAMLSPWTWLLPAGTVAVLALLALGVRPRLAEYR